MFLGIYDVCVSVAPQAKFWGGFLIHDFVYNVKKYYLGKYLMLFAPQAKNFKEKYRKKSIQCTL